MPKKELEKTQGELLEALADVKVRGKEQIGACVGKS